MSIPSSLLRLASQAAPRLCVALTAALPLFCPAQSLSLPQVVITASREPQPLERVVADVVVIDAQRIRASSADSLEDLLRREGGVALSRNGGPGQSAAVMLRGSSASSTVVLVDGVRIGSATLGQADLAGISLAMIERIEILRGPGSSLYGADAVGGVVQIITRRGDASPQASARVALGALGSSEGSVSMAGAAGDFDYSVGVSREASDGISAIRPADTFGQFNPDRDGFARTSWQLRGGFTPAPGHQVGVNLLQSRLRSQFDAAEFNPPTFAPDPAPDFRNRFDTRVAALDYRGTISALWTTRVKVATQRDDLITGGTQLDRFDTRRRQLTWQNTWAIDSARQFVAAVEGLNEAVDATPFASPLERSNTAIVLSYGARSGAHRWQADLRHDHNTDYGDADTGKLGWAMDLASGVTLRAVLGSAFRAPTFNDLYFPGFGVATVRPERSRSAEVGLQWHAADSSASATLYRNEVRDLIGFESDRSLCPADPAYDFGCARNVSRARLQGATLAASQRLGELSLRATLDLQGANDAVSGQRLARRAAHQAGLSADWSRGAWALGAELVGVGARPEGGAMLASYETLDLQLRWRLDSSWQFEVKLLNALDRRVEPARDYQTPGRQAWVGVRWTRAGH